MKYVLDTDVCIDLLRGDGTTRKRLEQESPDDVAVTAMTIAELLYGSQQSARPAVELERTRAFIESLQILDFDTAAAVHHAEIRSELTRKPIGERDLIIAATARAAGSTLVTRNTREFSRVPQLPVESWR